MSLDAMLVAHDPAALEALANRGLVRRATRDAEARTAVVKARDAQAATVEVGGFDVRLTGDGPKPSDCPCPATGICRHVLTAILILRAETGGHLPTTSAQADLLALDTDAIAKFAGADLSAAHVLATTGPIVNQTGEILRVEFADFKDPVQFIPGKALKDAVFKGPKSRARLVKAAAVLAVKRAAGQPVTTPKDAQTDPEGVSTALLDDISKGLERLVSATLRGGAASATDQMFDLAISARAQAAPRLTGLLRSLVTQSQHASTRHISFEPERFLAEAAEARALVAALQSTPWDLALLGSLQRKYEPAQALTFWALGAQSWHAPSGARGLRVFGFDPEAGHWISAGQARAAGADPSFSPNRAYELSLFGSGTVKAQIGHRITLPSPRISSDLQLANGVMGQNAGRLSLNDLSDAGVLKTTWSQAQADLDKRHTSGLRARRQPQPLLIAPQRIEMAGFDDIAQTFALALTDDDGARATLIVPADDAPLATWILHAGGALKAMLCVRLQTRSFPGLVLAPVAVFGQDKQGLAITNLSLDPLPGTKGAFKSLLDRWRGPDKLIRPAQDPITALADAVLRHLVDGLVGGQKDSRRLQARLDAAGLALLSAAVGRFQQAPTAANALIAAYLADRIADLA